MKRILIGIPLSIVLVIATMAIVGLFLPKNYKFERSVFIEAEPAAIFPYVNDLERWPEWSYWTPENIEGLEITRGEITSGKGASQTWVENEMNGKLEFTDSVPDERVSFETVIDSFPAIHSSIILEPTSETEEDEDGNKTTRVGTRVVWKANGRLGNDPLSGWMGVLIPSMMGRDYDHGLTKLKSHFTTTASNDESSNQEPPSDEEAPAPEGTTADDDAE